MWQRREIEIPLKGLAWGRWREPFACFLSLTASGPKRSDWSPRSLDLNLPGRPLPIEEGRKLYEGMCRVPE